MDQVTWILTTVLHHEDWLFSILTVILTVILTIRMNPDQIKALGTRSKGWRYGSLQIFEVLFTRHDSQLAIIFIICSFWVISSGQDVGG